MAQAIQPMIVSAERNRVPSSWVVSASLTVSRVRLVMPASGFPANV